MMLRQINKCYVNIMVVLIEAQKGAKSSEPRGVYEVFLQEVLFQLSFEG